ncbi:helix-turn-helix transcriptional regulator [Streptomyces griseorubiginosus]|uniref:helix-turn-helix transcriptional regulator n=1 Tax=Streptomyces griseorubiginosus TaxID=67304 RepID=UPI0036E46D4A
MAEMLDLFETRVPESGGPIAEVTDMLITLSEQAERWQADLLRTQDQLHSLFRAEERRQYGKSEPPGLLTPEQAVSLILDLLAHGARRISYVRPTDTPLLDCPEVRDALSANPQVCTQELVSRPAMVPSGGRGHSRFAVRATWTELNEIAIIDDSIALIPPVGADRSANVAVVRQPFVVQQLAQFFNASWALAANGQDPAPVRSLAEAELKHRIILLLAEGAKDETVARRLGISLRTCRRHVAEILSQLDSSSRFQAGVRAALLGSVPVNSPATLGRQ